MSQDNSCTALEKELESAPKYGRNAAWILLKALADEQEGAQGSGQRTIDSVMALLYELIYIDENRTSQ